MDRNGYIGRAPADSSVIVARQVFSPSGVTTDFTFSSGYTPGYLDLYLNGSRLVEGTDYTANDTSTISVLNGGADGGDVIEAVAYKAFNAATATVGISSAGSSISTQANTLNFIGTGNTFALRGNTIDISISGSGGGSGVASTITVADESSDTTCFPVFVTAATGDLNPKSGSNLTFNSSSGALTASSFVGALTGDVTGTATTATNAQGLTGTPNISVGTISASGSVSIAGTLTYEDVTNIDSVGIITARSDISIADKIIHTGDTNTAIRFPAADTFTVETGGSERIRVASDGNFGIRTTSPTDDLHIAASASGKGILIKTTGDTFPSLNFDANRSSSESANGTIRGYWNGTNVAQITLAGGSDTTNKDDGIIQFSTSSANNITEQMRLDSSGRLLVGTSASDQDALLTVARTGNGGTTPSTISSATVATFRATGGLGHEAHVSILGGSTGASQLNLGDRDDEDVASIRYDHNNNFMQFNVSAAERIRIGASGQIGIAGANYGSSGQVLTSKGSGSAVAWESVSTGISTEAATVTNGQTTLLDLGSAQDHKLTCTGTVTISCTGGTESESHTVRVINSGTATIGFSTYFLFPSGSAPSLPTADGAISLISFTVNRVGAAGTQLLAGASVNYS